MKKVSILLLSAFYINTANAQTPSILKDIYNQTNGSITSGSANYTKVGTTVFFRAGQNATGIELYKTDGTAEGTTMVKDIYEGIQSSLPAELTNSNGVLYFTAFEQTHGKELWKSDGTAEGTVLVKDIQPGVLGSEPYNLTVMNGVLYFSANTAANGIELWKSDGTEAGTVLVADIYAGIGSSGPRNLTNVSGTLFFSAAGGAESYSNKELWKSDGTSAGTILVKEIMPGGISGSNPAYFTNVNGVLFFSANDGATVNGTELWKSDGTEAGTMLVKNINPGPASSLPVNLIAIGNNLFFTANNGTNGYELWKSNGTEAGTMMVKEFNPGAAGGLSSSYPFADIGGALYLAASSPSTGLELWKSDGTEAGTVLIKDILSGSEGSTPTELTNVNGTLFFYTASSNKKSLWKSNGTTEGTVAVDNAVIGGGNYSDLYAGPTQLYFTYYGYKAAFPSTATGPEPWTSNGTDAGTFLIKDINTATPSSDPSKLCKVGDNVFFVANDGLHGAELWKTDGTPSGTILVKDIAVENTNPSNLTAINNTLFFTAYTYGSGIELWKSDGTNTGTVMVKDIVLGLGSSDPWNLTAVNGILYFSAISGANGREIWKSDGTDVGTYMVKDIMLGLGSSSSNPGGFTYLNGYVFFSANNTANGTELWKTDGTEAGTVLVKDIFTGIGSSVPSSFVSFKNKLYFSANDGVTGYELWTSDGTSAGTVIFKDIFEGVDMFNNSGSSAPHYMTVLGNTMYFSARGNNTGVELWKSDGTEAGTVLVKDIYPGDEGFFNSDPAYFTLINGTVFFSATTRYEWRELWKTDGTEVGTVMVKDIYPGTSASSSSPVNLTNYNGTLYFMARDVEHGMELWKSDGTETGTTVFDLMPGTADSKPTDFIIINNKLIFAAQDFEKGRELWVIDGGALPLSLLDFSAKKNDNKVLLNWQTNNEINTSHFIVQRSANNLSFNNIGRVETRNTAGTNDYNLTDLSPVNGINFYRLQMVDIDHKITYSPVIKIVFAGKNELQVFPNPAKNIITLSGLQQNGTISLFTTEGKLLKRQTITTPSVTLDMSMYSKGIYLLKYIHNSEMTNVKIVKE